MRLFFAGSDRHFKLQEARANELKAAARDLGMAASRQGYTILISSAKEHTVDFHVVDGARVVCRTENVEAQVEVHRTVSGWPVFETWDQPSFTPVLYQDAASNPRLGPRVGALNACDAVIALGGSTGTLEIGRLGIDMKKPLIAISSFGGAGKRLFEMLEVQYLQNSGVRNRLASLVGSWRGPQTAAQILEIAELLGGRHTYFLSYAHEDNSAADHVEALLGRCRREVIRDEHGLHPGELLEKQLRSGIASADTFLMLWSKDACASQWCDREVRIALEPTKKRRRIVCLLLDDTPLLEPLSNQLHLAGSGRAERANAILDLVEQEAPQ